MAVNFTLRKRFALDPDQDPLGRSWAGWDPTRSDEELWEANRGRWWLGSAWRDERFATLSFQGHIEVVVEIDGHELVADPPHVQLKHALRGRVLRPGDPVRDGLVGRPVPPTRKPVRYVDSSDVDALSSEERARRAPSGTSTAFLLTHNPGLWEWDEAEYASEVARTAAGALVRGRWSTGTRTGGVQPGDRAFLLRQGSRGRGLVGSGTFTSRVFPAAHWDDSGGVANYANVDWDVLLDPGDPLPTADLQARFSSQNWTPQSSGTSIRRDILTELESAWGAHVGRPLPRRTAPRQGWQLDPLRRKKVEDAAQDRLTALYEAWGWVVRDTRHGNPYDAVATKGDQVHYLEAKGTETAGGSVLVTQGEIEHATHNAGKCVIGVLSSVRFTPSGEVDPRSGRFRVYSWIPSAGELRPVTLSWTPGDAEAPMYEA